MPDTCILEAAAHRASALEDRHGIAIWWGFDAIGLILTAQCGAEKIEKRISWSELNRADHPSYKLEMAEQAALAGLSN